MSTQDTEHLSPLDTLYELTESALRCARHGDLNGIFSCISKKSYAVEQIAATLNNSASGPEPFEIKKMKSILEKDRMLENILEGYKGKLTSEIEKIRSMKSLKQRFAGTTFTRPRCIDKRA